MPKKRQHKLKDRKNTERAKRNPADEITTANMFTSNASKSKPYMTQNIKVLVRATNAMLRLLFARDKKKRINPTNRIIPPAIFFRSIFICSFAKSG